MSIAIVFIVGLCVSAMSFVAVLLVGLQEAGDPDQSRLEDLTDLEREIVSR